MSELSVMIEADEPLRTRARYTLDTYLDALGLPYVHVAREQRDAERERRLTLYYGSDARRAPERSVAIVAAETNRLRQPVWIEPTDERFCAFGSGEAIPVPFVTGLGPETTAMARVRGSNGPTLEGVTAIAWEEGQRLTVGADIVISGFLLLSRVEEQEAEKRDELDRYLAAQSLAHSWGVLDRPVVDEYAGLLLQALLYVADSVGIPILRKAPWPYSRPFAACLTHDIDLLKRCSVTNLAKDVARCLLPSSKGPGFGDRLRAIGELIGGLLRWRHPTNNLDHIVDMDEALGCRSTFFFLPCVDDVLIEGRSIVNRYEINKTRVQQTIRSVRNRGFDVGLHGSSWSYLDPRQIAYERSRVEALAGAEIAGNRQHFLRLRVPDTFRYLQQSGISFDSSLGYSDAVGYRASWSFPFFPYDFHAERPLGLLEIPLIVMEGVLLNNNGARVEDSWTEIQALLERTRKGHGLLTILWHNTSYLSLHAPGFNELYARTLQWIVEHGGWGCSAAELDSWWRQRRNTRVTISAAGPDRYRCKVIPGSNAPRISLELFGSAAVSVRECSGCRVSHNTLQGRRGWTSLDVEITRPDATDLEFVFEQRPDPLTTSV